MSEPFHHGEITVQERAGERDLARRRGAGIASRIPPGGLSFLAGQRLLALSAVGDEGRLWTSTWWGEPGFAQSTDGHRVDIAPSFSTASPEDPVLRCLSVGGDVGMLAIELESRRRLRINGTVESVSPGGIGVLVRESVGNCPKYIQRRHLHEVPTTPSRPEPVDAGRALDDERRALLERADTAFVGSLHPASGVDTSHRGGAPGFLRVLDATTLRVPDYPGNSMFMTLGNFVADPRASLAVLDFERGRVLSLSGSARVHFDGDDPVLPTGGTGRFWDFSVREWVEHSLPSTLRWELLEASPFNPQAPDQREGS